MAATNYSPYRPKNVDCIKFGSTAWTTTDFASTTSALDTTFATNNATLLLDLVGARDANSPVKSEAFAKSITESGNERSQNEDNLLGANTDGSQNQELGQTNVTQQIVTATLVYRNNVPYSIFNDTTKCCLMTLDNSETAATGVVNFAYNNITVLHVGSKTINSDGLMEQQIKFSHKGGTTGAAIAVTQTSPAETWSRIKGGDFAEEVRLT